MKLVKPQQLVFLKNAYQLEKECYLGISSVVGCYLDKTDHFITEPEVWDVWDKSPKSVPFLDVPVVKQFAEYVLVGSASIGREVTSLDAEVNVGKLKKEWRIFGEGSYARRKNFYEVEMDHKNVFGGSENSYNPLGKGNTVIGGAPNVVLRKGDRLFERECLASPSPIPFNFFERKKYLDKIAPIMANPQYMEEVYPGYPKSFDLRYFQIAAPDQWLNSSFWPSGSNFSLTGFSRTGDIIKGNFPKVLGRAFGVVNNDMIEIPLFLQTIWLVPDFNVALLIFTGEVQIKELTEEPYDSLLLALDSDSNPRPLEYYSGILEKRQSKETKLDSLLDLELMPNNAKVNVIRSMKDHPSSIRYVAKPMEKEEVDQYFKTIKEAIELSEEYSLDKEVENLHQFEREQTRFEDIFSLSDEVYFEDKNYKEFHSYDANILKKDFVNCQFKGIDFSNYKFNSCVFKQCHFYTCRFIENHFNETILDGCEFSECSMGVIQVKDTQWISLEFSRSKLKGISFTNSKLNEARIDDCDLNDFQFSGSEINTTTFSNSKINNFELTESTMLSSILKNTHLGLARFCKSKVEKNSIIGCQLKECSFINSFLSSFVVGPDSKLEKCVFQDSWLEKIGMGNTVLDRNLFEHCNIKEINGSNSDFNGSKFVNCDVMTAIFKNAILVGTKWNECGLQQNIFYNSDVRDSLFEECNLIGSNMALILRNGNTNFKRCLLDKVLWLPQRNNV